MKKVVFFLTGLDSGGLENYLLRFLQFKSEFFSEIFIFCKGGKGGQLERDFLSISNVKIVKKRISFFNPLDYMKLMSFMKKERFDVACDFTGNFSGLVLLCAKYAGVNNRVVFYRGASDHFYNNFIKKIYNDFMKRLTYTHAVHILSNSQSAVDYFYNKRLQDQRFKVIYNGIDASKFDVGNANLRQEFNIPEQAFVIGHTGRFNYAKNHDTILAVAELLIKKYSDVYFILCGNGVKNNLENKINELGISEYVRLFENRSDIPIFLNTMDTYFFPSVTEGQPNALIEAMIMGIPFVASNIEPIKETVTDHSKLFNPFDINGYTLALEGLYLSKVQKDLNLKEEMIAKFDYKERFDQFYNILIK